MATTNGAAYRSSILNHLFNNAALTPPATVYLGYCTDAISSGSATECTDANYARQAITYTTSSAGSSIASSSTCTFPAQASGGNVTGTALFTASTGGSQMCDWKALSGGTLTLAAGSAFKESSGNDTIAGAWS